MDLESVYKKKIIIGVSWQYNSKISNIDYAFTTGLFNENTLISTDLGINRSMEDLNSGYNLFDFRFKYNLQKDFTLGILCENLLNNDFIIRHSLCPSNKFGESCINEAKSPRAWRKRKVFRCK